MIIAVVAVVSVFRTGLPVQAVLLLFDFFDFFYIHLTILHNIITLNKLKMFLTFSC